MFFGRIGLEVVLTLQERFIIAHARIPKDPEQKVESKVLFTMYKKNGRLLEVFLGYLIENSHKA